MLSICIEADQLTDYTRFETKKVPPKRDFVLWAMLDSNQRPPACKAGALNQLS